MRHRPPGAAAVLLLRLALALPPPLGGVPERPLPQLDPSDRVRRASSDSPIAGCARPTLRNESKFLAIEFSNEQLNKFIGFAGDALFFARALGRVLVEPTMLSSRNFGVPRPSSDPCVHGAPRTVAAAAACLRNVERLSEYLDLGRACRYVPIIAQADFFHLQRLFPDRLGAPVVRRAKPSEAGIGALRSKAGFKSRVRSWLAAYEDAPVLVLHGFSRSNVDDPLSLLRLTPRERSASTSRSPPVPAFGIAPHLRRFAGALYHAALRPGARLACVQWRSEKPEAESPGVVPCATALGAAYAAGRRERVRGMGAADAAVLVTDLYPGNSATYNERNASGARHALALLRDALPLHEQLQAAMRAIPDAGERGLVEQLVCAHATTLLVCAPPLSGHSATRLGPKPMCKHCARRQSGYSHAILRYHFELLARSKGGAAARQGDKSLYTW